MIRSMTGFSKTETSEADVAVVAEIRSYNSRYLDVVLRIPPSVQPLEDKIRNLISGKISRGRVEVRLQIQDAAEEAAAFEVDEPKARAYFQAIERLRDMFGLRSDRMLDILAGAGGMIRPAETEKDIAAYWPTVEACLMETLDSLNGMREKEGRFLAEDIRARLAKIEAWIDAVDAEAGDLLSYYQDRLKERISALTGGITEIDPARIAQEAAFLADRSDISEEIVRARSHAEQFRATMKADEPCGRKLNFLLQEFLREFNTMGSKAGKARLSHNIVEMKTELEKIREQVQNIE